MDLKESTSIKSAGYINLDYFSPYKALLLSYNSITYLKIYLRPSIYLDTFALSLVITCRLHKLQAIISSLEPDCYLLYYYLYTIYIISISVPSV